MGRSDEELNPAAERITEAFGAAIKAGEVGDTTEGMPAQWVMIGTYYDDEGDTRTVFLTDTGARLQETLGLLQLGVIAWNEHGRRWIHDE